MSFSRSVRSEVSSTRPESKSAMYASSSLIQLSAASEGTQRQYTNKQFHLKHSGCFKLSIDFYSSWEFLPGNIRETFGYMPCKAFCGFMYVITRSYSVSSPNPFGFYMAKSRNHDLDLIRGVPGPENPKIINPELNQVGCLSRGLYAPM